MAIPREAILRLVDTRLQEAIHLVVLTVVTPPQEALLAGHMEQEVQVLHIQTVLQPTIQDMEVVHRREEDNLLQDLVVPISRKAHVLPDARSATLTTIAISANQATHYRTEHVI